MKFLVDELKSRNKILLGNNALIMKKLSLIGKNEDKNIRKNVNSIRLQPPKPNIVKLFTVFDSVVSAPPMVIK